MTLPAGLGTLLEENPSAALVVGETGSAVSLPRRAGRSRCPRNLLRCHRDRSLICPNRKNPLANSQLRPSQLFVSSCAYRRPCLSTPSPSPSPALSPAPPPAPAAPSPVRAPGATFAPGLSDLVPDKQPRSPYLRAAAERRAAGSRSSRLSAHFSGALALRRSSSRRWRRSRDSARVLRLRACSTWICLDRVRGRSLTWTKSASPASRSADP